jgi:hypothetical protein
MAVLTSLQVDYNAQPYPESSPDDGYSSSCSDDLVLSSTDNLEVSFGSSSNSPYTLHCLCYREGSRIPFVVNIFRLDESGSKLVVELQKRMGCSMQFSSIVHTVRKELGEKGFVETDSEMSLSSLSSSSLMAPLPLPSESLDQQIDEQQAAESSVKSLMQMVESDFVDLQSKALDVLSHISTERKIQGSLSGSSDVIGKLVDCVKAKSEQLHRPALSTLANLVTKQRGSVAKLVYEKGICDSLLSSLSSPIPQVVRESARLLTNLSVALGSDMDGEIVKTAVGKLASVSDPLVRSQTVRLLEVMNKRGLSHSKLEISMDSSLSGKQQFAPSSPVSWTTSTSF